MINYEKEILNVLREAGAYGLSIKKITKHVYNSCQRLFEPVEYQEIHNIVVKYLKKNTKAPYAKIQHTDIRGIYRLCELPQKEQQQHFDFEKYKYEQDEGEHTAFLEEPMLPFM